MAGEKVHNDQRPGSYRPPVPAPVPVPWEYGAAMFMGSAACHRLCASVNACLMDLSPPRLGPGCIRLLEAQICAIHRHCR